MSEMGLEPTQISPHAPQACASTVPPLRHIRELKSILVSDKERRKSTTVL